MLDLATSHDVDDVSEVLVDAFTDDPMNEYMFPDPARRTGQVGRLTRLIAQRGVAHGHGYVFRSDARVLGAAMWAPAGKRFFTADDAERLTDIIVSTDPGRADLIFSGIAQMHEYMPSDPHFVLEMIGVRRDAQGRGIGRQLMALVLDHIDRLGCHSYLESSNPRNVSLYERCGFEVLAEVQMPEHGPVVRPMFRPAR